MRIHKIKLVEKGMECFERDCWFLVSRVVKNKDGSYSILNVVGADEYAQHMLMTMHLQMHLLLSH
jgi:trehalose/maltose hydrolase-like predicted phosphorylase